MLRVQRLTSRDINTCVRCKAGGARLAVECLYGGRGLLDAAKACARQVQASDRPEILDSRLMHDPGRRHNRRGSPALQEISMNKNERRDGMRSLNKVAATPAQSTH